ADLSATFAAFADSPYQVPAAELSKATLPEVVSDYVTALEKGWKANVLQK
ncbi:MAG: ABC transporter substrate-binding protein, partial [Frankiales bacterium]|nr:ABC transporter substrate-binding protein [Frankiales bacterium]